MRWEGINACQRVSFYFFIYLLIFGVPLWRHCAEVVIDAGGLCSGTRPFLAAARAACQPVLFYLQAALGADSAGPESVFASCYRIISRWTSWRRRSLAGGCSDCQKRLKSSNLQSALESVAIFRGNGENWRADGWLGLAWRSVWGVWFFCYLILFIFLLNHQSWRWTSKNFSRWLDFYRALVPALQSSPVRQSTAFNPQYSAQ